MHPARIAELLAPFLGEFESRSGNVSLAAVASENFYQAEQLTADDLYRISTYIDILQRWNARVNLTAVRHPEEIVTRHFGESLFAARLLFGERYFGVRHLSTESGSSHNREISEERERLGDHGRLDNRGRAALQGRVEGASENRPSGPAIAVADLGSGAGFPGIPIKLWAPEISLTLVESNHKKATFLREVARALTLTNINIMNVRAETLTGKKFNAVTLRAVERFASILPIAAGLVAPEGRLALLISESQLSNAKATISQLAPSIPAWSNPTWQVDPIPLSNTRVIAIARLSTGNQTHQCEHISG